jgi:hypothetical protein
MSRVTEGLDEKFSPTIAKILPFLGNFCDILSKILPMSRTKSVIVGLSKKVSMSRSRRVVELNEMVQYIISTAVEMVVTHDIVVSQWQQAFPYLLAYTQGILMRVPELVPS